MRTAINVIILHFVVLLCLAGASSVLAQTFEASVGLGFVFSDADVTAVPPAHVEGDTSPGTSWIRYDVSAYAGFLESSHDLYACCVDNGKAIATWLVEDLIFASPGGTGGTADVTFNFEASAQPNFDGSTLTVKASVGGGFVTQGTWIAGPTASSGVFAGYDASTLDDSFTSTVFSVPLDVPVSFFVSAEAGTGSYQVVSSISTLVTLPAPGSGGPVFNFVSGPAGVTVNSVQGDIVNNEWGGSGVIAPPPPPPPVPAISAPARVLLFALMAILGAWARRAASISAANGSRLLG